MEIVSQYLICFSGFKGKTMFHCIRRCGRGTLLHFASKVAILKIIEMIRLATTLFENKQLDLESWLRGGIQYVSVSFSPLPIFLLFGWLIYQGNILTSVDIRVNWIVQFLWPQIIVSFTPQCAERIFNKIAKALNETFTGLKLMLQGFRIYFVWNPSIKGIESTS